jgi:hypothetical protein
MSCTRSSTGYFGPSTAINSYKSPDRQDHELTDAILAAGYVKVSEAAIERAAKASGYKPSVVRAVVAALREET